MTDIHVAPTTVLLMAGRTLDHRLRWAVRLFRLGVRHVVTPDDVDAERAERVEQHHGAGKSWRSNRIAFSVDSAPPAALTDLPILWWYTDNSQAFWEACLAINASGTKANMDRTIQALCGQDVPPAPIWLCESATRYPVVAPLLMSRTADICLVSSNPDEEADGDLRRRLAVAAVTLRS